MNVFVTFSPRDEEWPQSRTDEFKETLVKYLTDQNYEYRLVTSLGETRTHYHFHVHVIKVRERRVDSLRRTIMKSLNLESDGTFKFRFERQKGRHRHVEHYMDENYKEGDNNDDIMSPRYYELLEKLKLDEMTLTQHELFGMVKSQCDDLKYSNPGELLYSYDIGRIIDSIIDEGYSIHRIREDEVERIHTQMLYWYGRKRFSSRYTRV